MVFIDILMNFVIIFVLDGENIGVGDADKKYHITTSL